MIGIALSVMDKFYKNKSKSFKLELLTDLFNHQEKYENDEVLGRIVKELKIKKEPKKMLSLSTSRLEYTTFGRQDIEEGAINQMEVAMKLPVTVAGALMPDAHQGYGLPIGGILATKNAVIPYGVGVDIGCRMCMSIFPLDANFLERHRSNLKNILIENTRFGQDVFKTPMDDPLLEREEFSSLPFVKSLKDKAYMQIGSSGSGNHFVEFGIAEILEQGTLNIAPGKYLALLSHSGSRGLGAEIARHFTRIAMEKCKLPHEATHLAWLDLSSEEGQEYWISMNLAGDYASACHNQIHKRISKALGERGIVMIENHHNFAWKETLADGTEVIVHRKGATPAGKDVTGIIPGSMTAPGYIVKGKGNISSIQSASHGAGRLMSRSKAKSSITRKELKQHLERFNVELIGGDVDEAPMAYKNIEKVMDYQKNLIEVVGIFIPKIVRMAGGKG